MSWPTRALPRCRVLGPFRLEALGPQHNERDHAAWMGSLDHIRATPGFRPELWGGDTWPYPMDADANLADLVRHLAEFDAGEAYAFSVLGHPGDEVVGCVYLDPDPDGDTDVVARAWTVASWADHDPDLVDAVRRWVAAEWPGTTVRWPGRDPRSENDEGPDP